MTQSLIDRLAARGITIAPEHVGPLDADQPFVVEVQLKGPDQPEAVIGFSAAHRHVLDRFVEERTGSHAPRIASWLDAARERTRDVGVQIGRDDRLQIYARGHFPVEVVAEANRAAKLPVAPHVVRNLLVLCGRVEAEIIGIEARGEQLGTAVYAGMLHSSVESKAALRDSVWVLLEAIAPGDAGERWRAAASRLLEVVGEEWTYLSIEPVDKPTWVKLDLGVRPLALVRAIGDMLGKAAVPPGLIDAATRLGLDPVTHVGIKWSPEPRVSLYGRVI